MRRSFHVLELAAAQSPPENRADRENQYKRKGDQQIKDIHGPSILIAVQRRNHNPEPIPARPAAQDSVVAAFPDQAKRVQHHDQRTG